MIAWPDSNLRHQTLGSGAHREIVESRARRIQRVIALRLTCARLRQFSTAVRACSLLLCDRELGLRARSGQLQAGDCVFRGGGSFGDPELVRRPAHRNLRVFEFLTRDATDGGEHRYSSLVRDGLVVCDLGALHRVFPRVIRNTVGGTLRDSHLRRDLGEFHGERVDVLIQHLVVSLELADLVLHACRVEGQLGDRATRLFIVELENCLPRGHAVTDRDKHLAHRARGGGRERCDVARTDDARVVVVVRRRRKRQRVFGRDLASRHPSGACDRHGEDPRGRPPRV